MAIFMSHKTSFPFGDERNPLRDRIILSSLRQISRTSIDWVTTGFNFWLVFVISSSVPRGTKCLYLTR